MTNFRTARPRPPSPGRAGFYLMHRGWMDHPVLNAARESFCRRAAWAWMIEQAAWRPTRSAVGGKWVDLGRGQFTHSLRFMAAAWGWSEPAVRRFILALSTAEMIQTKTDAGQMVITLCNYDRFQASGDQADAEATQTRRSPDAEKKQGKEKKESFPSERAPAAPQEGDLDSDSRGVPAPALSARQLLWRDGLDIIAHLTGKPAGRCRATLGKLLAIAGDDCALVLGKLQEASSMHPMPSAVAWLTRACDPSGRAPPKPRTRAAEPRAAEPCDAAFVEEIPAMKAAPVTAPAPDAPETPEAPATPEERMQMAAEIREKYGFGGRGRRGELPLSGTKSPPRGTPVPPAPVPSDHLKKSYETAALRLAGTRQAHLLLRRASSLPSHADETESQPAETVGGA